MGFSRQQYWSGLPFPSPGDLHNPGIAPGSLALQASSLPTELSEVILEKNKDMETIKRSMVARVGLGEVKMQSIKDFLRQKNTLFDIVWWFYVIILLFKSIEYKTPKVNPVVNYRFSVIIMCQCRFILDKNLLFWWLILITGEVMNVWGQGYLGNFCAFLSMLL